MYDEMTNSDFICLLHDYPSADQEEVFSEAARRIRKLEAQVRAWESAADNGSGCDTPEGLRNLERQHNEAREAFVIATDQLVQVQGELRQVREENAKLREALGKIKRRHCIMGSTGDYRQGQLDALEVTGTIAGLALTQVDIQKP
jgi:transposase-like protein